MPALPNVAKVVRVDFHQTFANDLSCLNRIFLSYAGALSQADAQTWVNTINTSWGRPTAMKGVQVAAAALSRVVLTDLTSNTSPQAENDTAISGTNASNPLSAGAAFCLKFKLARRYRGGHPRIYILGASQNLLFNAQQWSATTITAYLAAWNDFMTNGPLTAPSAVSTVNHVNVSYFSGFHNVTFPSGRIRPVPTLRNTPAVDLVVAYAGNPQVASQRRRNQQSR